jgi:UDP-N-acetylmuramoyl-tripeptide--D-alanyl-D-alanine ligase
MIPLRYAELETLLGCAASGRDPEIHAIVSDSRKVSTGTLFAALPGQRVDGHDFAGAAVAAGATALLVTRRLDCRVPQLVVDDVLVALGRIARLLRDRLDPPVVGITGSNGKTTVKEMLASILRLEGRVLATEGNYNNELGVPLTLFRLEPRHRYAVIEMGASKPGDIAYLAGIAAPDVGLVNNIGPAHLEGFGSVEGVARTKGEMYAALPADGCAVINADEPWADLWRELNTAGRVLTFGTADGAEVRLDEAAETCRIVTPAGVIEADLPLPGRHNRLNAAAATAVALALDIDMDIIRHGLEKVVPVPGRLNLLQTTAGWTVIDDSYNANPASLYSALQVLASLPGERWLVLGDMKELGPGSRKMHREVGETAAVMGVKRLFAVGEMAADAVDAFGPGGRHFADRDALAQALRREIRPGVNCLVKGSRSMGMEGIVEALVGESGLREAG